LIAASFLVTIGAGHARAQDSTPAGPTGAIEVTVRRASTRQGVPEATVRLIGTTRSAVTDAAGRAVLRQVVPAIYSLWVTAIGFRPVAVSDVVASSGKTQTVTVELWPSPIEVEELTAAAYFQPTPDAGGQSDVFRAEEARRAPGVQEDVVRAVALFPGVAVTTAGRNDLVVRGGAPFENLFIVDNIEVPNINHFGSQGSTGGPLSLINIDFVRSVSFSSGGFGARYGDRTSAVTNISLRDGSRDRLAGELNLSATGFGLIGEGPLGGDGSFLLSARRSYLDLIFKAAGFSFVPAYWDFQLKATRPVSQGGTLSFLTIGALNTISFINEDAEDRFDNSRILAPEQRQYFSGLTYQQTFDRGYAALTLGRTHTRFRTVQRDSLDPPQVVFQSFSTEGEESLRTDLTLELTPTLTASVGNVAKYASTLSYDVMLPGNLRRDAAGMPAPLRVDTSFTAFRNATYAEGTWRRGRWAATIGLRADYYAFLRRSVRLSERLGLSYRVGRNSEIRLSRGRYFQAPSYIWLVGDAGNPQELEPIRATQIGVGFEHLLRPDLRLQIEGYHKTYRDYPARRFRPQAVLAPTGFEDVTNDIPFGLEPLVSRGTGRAYGLEALLQKRLSTTPLFGLVSLSLGRSEFEGLDEITRPGAFDTRFIATLLAGYRFDPRWELSGKFRVASGQPTTPFISSGPRAGSLDFSRYNSGPRLPTFHALDLRVDRRWSFRSWQLEVYVDVQNVYGRSNVSRVRWNAQEQGVENDESLGILPSIGMNIEF